MERNHTPRSNDKANPTQGSQENQGQTPRQTPPSRSLGPQNSGSQHDPRSPSGFAHPEESGRITSDHPSAQRQLRHEFHSRAGFCARQHPWHSL
ncbi:MAG: hypothetical protein IM572_07900 [Chitinophagaceae bacterium]|nr:hypothetical protein [Chitinophagaceae bacterium]